MTATARRLDTLDLMIVESDLLGPVTVDPADVLRLPAGLIGLPQARDFVLLPAAQGGLYWLQSTELSALAFLLIDPFLYFEDYAVELATGDVRDLGGPVQDSRIAILAVVTLPASKDDLPTANLQGPIALNLRTRLGKQIAMPESEFGTTCTFRFPDS